VVNVIASRLLKPRAGESPARSYTLLAARPLIGAIAFTFDAFGSIVAMMLDASLGALLAAVAMIVRVAARFPTRAAAKPGLG
jgi:hypothetical protein